jgi:hypothetical protein
MPKPNFSQKAQAIIDKTNQPKNLEDFLSDDKNEASNLTKKDETDDEIKLKRFVREECRFPEELSERLRFAAYKLHKKKLHIIQEALSKHLKKLGF